MVESGNSFMTTSETISKQEVSAPLPISSWVNYDPVEIPILPGQNMFCTYASEYNP